MELRVLRYFLETAREGNMTRAAERLHVTQPTLSRQIKELEKELGKDLFVRHNFSVSLTAEGMILRKRAEDLISIADKIENEFMTMDDITGGQISIGCAESYLIDYLAQAIKNVNHAHPGIHYSIVSGGTDQVDEKVVNGILDFAFIVEPPDLSKFNYIELPKTDTWGVIMPRDCPLAEKDEITFEDLLPYPLFCTEQSIRADLPRWCGSDVERLNFIINYNLLNNASILVKEGLGLCLGFDKILDLNDKSPLVFRPLYPVLENKMYVIWNKYQVFSPAASLLLDEIHKVIES